MRIVFMGTPEFAVPSLEALTALEDVKVVGVFTQPDKPQGRKMILTPPERELCSFIWGTTRIQSHRTPEEQ